MKTTLTIIVTTTILSAPLLLSACTGTRAGISQDAERFGERMQKVGTALTEP